MKSLLCKPQIEHPLWAVSKIDFSDAFDGGASNISRLRSLPTSRTLIDSIISTTIIASVNIKNKLK